MPQPNNIYKNSRRSMLLMKEEIFNSSTEAETAYENHKVSGEYSLVKKTSFKTGAKPNKYNNFKQSYSYAVRCYKKQ